jgi:anaerobic ribonucleoside-triphosphate reductase activating protein
MTDLKLNLHAVLGGTTVNGPGSRTAVWTQGCRKGCKGCFNPETWGERERDLMDPAALAERVLAMGDEGLTLTGGDPLEQPEALLAFLKALHDGEGKLRGFPRGVICFTGYTRAEVEAIPEAAACLPYIDLLIDGRYVESLRYTSGLAGSSNQNFNFNPAPGRGRALIPEGEVRTDQGVEVFGGEDNTVEVTGFPVIDRKWLGKLGLKVLP